MTTTSPSAPGSTVRGGRAAASARARPADAAAGSHAADDAAGDIGTLPPGSRLIKTTSGNTLAKTTCGNTLIKTESGNFVPLHTALSGAETVKSSSMANFYYRGAKTSSEDMLGTLDEQSKGT